MIGCLKAFSESHDQDINVGTQPCWLQYLDILLKPRRLSLDFAKNKYLIKNLTKSRFTLNSHKNQAKCTIH